MQRNQQRGLQVTQSPQQADMKRRRERIALIERLPNLGAALAQAGLVDRHPGQPPVAQRQSALEDRREQLLRLPTPTRVEKVFAAAAALFAAVGPDDARESVAADADETAEALAHGARISALLGETRAPWGTQAEQMGQRHEGPSGSSGWLISLIRGAGFREQVNGVISAAS